MSTKIYRVPIPDSAKKDIVAAIKQVERETDMNVLAKMKDILNKTFGEANNQIIKPSLENMELSAPQAGIVRFGETSALSQVTSLGMLNYIVIVRFPEVEITNSSKRSMLIHDLFVRFKILPSGLMLNSLEGILASPTAAQMLSGYQHSHLNRVQGYSKLPWSHFCRGTGPIAQSQVVLGDSFNEIDFRLFCLHLKAFVAWESIEGTPYCRLDQVGTAGPAVIAAPILPSGELDTACRALYGKLSSKFDDGQIADLLDVDIRDGKVSVSPKKELGLELGRIINSSREGTILGTRPKYELISYLQENGNYVIVRPSSSPALPPYDADRPLLHFKGEEIKLRPHNTESEIKSEKYANPYITKRFCEVFERRINRIAPGVTVD